MTVMTEERTQTAFGPGNDAAAASHATGRAHPPAAPVLGRSADQRAKHRQRARDLFAQLAALPDHDPARMPLRDELVEMHTGLVHYLARRFDGRGEPHDDLAQVAMVGLLKAIDRFDPGRGLEFSTFATPTIVGEIKRHFRDTGWAIHVPRRLQELSLQVTRGSADLATELGRSPTIDELAAHLGTTCEKVLEGLECARAYSTVTLDAPVSASAGADPNATTLGDTLGDDDPGLDEVEVRETLRPLLEALPERERQIVMLRFFKNMTQTQIAAEVGLSQMHVSRLLSQTLTRLRDLATADPAENSAHA